MISVVRQSAETLALVVGGLEVEDVLILLAHVIDGGGVGEVALHLHGCEILDTVDAQGKLRLHGEHLHGTEILLVHLAFAVEQPHLFADEASHDEARLHAGESGSFVDDGGILQNRRLESRPCRVVHPRNHIALERLHLVRFQDIIHIV